MKIAGIYLAAGNSSRMGCHKLSLKIDERTLGCLALATALKSSLDEIYIIVKDTDIMNWLQPEIKSNKKCKIYKCTTAYQGQAESLRHGILMAQKRGADAVIIMLADQPFITIQMIESMIVHIKNNSTYKFIATTFNQVIMPPVLFTSAMYPKLLKLQGDRGARAILQGDLLLEGLLLPCHDKRLIFDVDTACDYDKAVSLAKTHHPPI